MSIDRFKDYDEAKQAQPIIPEQGLIGCLTDLLKAFTPLAWPLVIIVALILGAVFGPRFVKVVSNAMQDFTAQWAENKTDDSLEESSQENKKPARMPKSNQSLRDESWKIEQTVDAIFHEIREGGSVSDDFFENAVKLNDAIGFHNDHIFKIGQPHLAIEPITLSEPHINPKSLYSKLFELKAKCVQYANKGAKKDVELESYISGLALRLNTFLAVLKRNKLALLSENGVSSSEPSPTEARSTQTRKRCVTTNCKSQSNEPSQQLEADDNLSIDGKDNPPI